MAVLLVSHDLAVIAGHCDRVIVMYAGMIMESGPVEAVLREPRNPYTLALLEARPRPRRAARRAAQDHSRRAAGSARASRRLRFRGPVRAHDSHLPNDAAASGAIRREPCLALPSGGRSGLRMSEAEIRVERSAAARGRFAGQDLSPAGRGPFARKSARPALDGVSFAMSQGRSFGIVGESGSGKSTLARIALALDRPTAGAVRLQGRSLFDMPRGELRATRAHMQMVFQDPYGSLDPRQRVGDNRRRAAGGVGRSGPGRTPRPRRSFARGRRPQGFRRRKTPA